MEQEGPIKIIVSPDDFERIKKEGMTEKEMLKIKKIVGEWAELKAKYEEEK